MVAHYDGSNLGLAKKPHSACRQYWQNTRKFHMGPERRWLDIGYSFGVCPHGIVFEGRGFGYVQAAQPGGNQTWTSCTFMTGDAEDPTTAQLNAWKELRSWLRGKGLAAAVRGHRDFISTSCPGSDLYAMVKSGALTGAVEEDDVSADDVWNYGIDTGDGGKPWRAKTVLGHMEKEQDDIQSRVKSIETKVDGIQAALDEMKTLLQSNGT